MNHYSLDIETLSTQQNAVITDVAMTYFKDGRHQKDMHVQMADQPGRHRNLDTLLWRVEQDMSSACEGSTDPEGLYIKIATFIEDKEAPIFVKGPHFDIAILENLWGQQGPWHYRQPMDLRTFLFAKGYSDRQAPMGATHNPLNDCYDQTAHLLNSLRDEPQFHAFLHESGNMKPQKMADQYRNEGYWVRYNVDNLDGFTHVNGEKV